MIVMGCDVGSIFSKAVILDGDDIAASRMMRTTGNAASEIGGLLDSVIKDAGLDSGKVDCLVATGNGADLVKGADFIEDVITCAGAAAAFYFQDVRLCIDVGGQSITSMLLNEDGEVTNFMRNDKCASGSGRFLEVMSEKLNLDIEKIDEIVARSSRPVEITAQCGVFAESEVITYVNDGVETPDIMAGVCNCVASMVVAQGRKFRGAQHYTITGGVARIEAVSNIIQQKLGGTYLKFPADTRLAAALGAAVIGGSE